MTKQTFIIEFITLLLSIPSAALSLTLYSPSDGASIYQGDLTTIDWGDVYGATYYQVYIDNNGCGFGSPEVGFNNGLSDDWVDDGVTSISSFPFSSIINNPLPQNLYYWKVFAFNSSGTVIDESSCRSFALLLKTPSGVTVEYQSENDWNLVSWDSVPGATKYEVYWGTNSDVTTGSEGPLTTESLSYAHPGEHGSCYYYKVRAVDPGGASPLSAYDAVCVPYPDLVVVGESVNSTTIQEGSSVIASCSVKNQGAGAAESSYVGYYLSDDTDYDSGDLYLGRDGVASLSSQDSASESETVTIPVNTEGGVKYILFYADMYDSVTESNNDNNIGYRQITVTEAPEGSLDAADCTSIRGWAWDPDTSSSIDVKIYYDGDKNNGILLGTYFADLFRQDLTSFSNGYHAFNVETPIFLKNDVNHNIYAYAVDSGDGTLTELSGSYKSLTCSMPLPAVPDNFTATTNGDGILLAWDVVSDLSIQKYEIFWGTSSEVDESSNLITDITESPFQHGPLDAKVTYFYRIRSCDGSICGDLSPVQSAIAPKADLTISINPLLNDPSGRNVEQGTGFPITCILKRTGGLLRPTSNYALVYGYINQSTDPSTATDAHQVFDENSTPALQVTAIDLDDGEQTVNFTVPVPAEIEGQFYIHLKVDGPAYWDESDEGNNWATSSETILVWRDEIPTTDSDNGILARTWDSADVYWVNKYAKKWKLVGIDLDPPNEPIESVITQLGYTDVGVHWYRAGALDSLITARDILLNNDNFVYRKQGSTLEASTVFIVRNGMSDWFFNWDTFVNSEFSSEDVYWATDVGFNWIQQNYPLGQMIGLQPRIRVEPSRMFFY